MPPPALCGRPYLRCFSADAADEAADQIHAEEETSLSGAGFYL